MASFNKVILMGNLTRDPELRQTQSGTSVLGASVAVNESYTSADGSKRDNTSFIELTAFGKTAENISKFFRKGDPILIEGRLKQESWNDKQSGQARSKLVVIVEKFEFVKSREAANATTGGAQDGSQRSTQANTHTESQRDFIDERKEQSWTDDDDVPF